MSLKMEYVILTSDNTQDLMSQIQEYMDKREVVDYIGGVTATGDRMHGSMIFAQALVLGRES